LTTHLYQRRQQQWRQQIQQRQLGAATPVLTSPLTPAYINITSDGDTVQRQSGKLVDIPIDLNFSGRLGLDSNYTSTTDLTAQLALNWNPGGPFGDRLVVFDGTATWKKFSSGQLTIKATDSAQTGSSISGTTITGLTSTAQLVPGMTLTNSTGTGTLAAGTVISTIVSATSITVNNAASVNGTLTNLTFKLPASTVFDVILVNDAGTLRLLWGPAWSSATARASVLAIQNGINVNSGSWTTGWTNGAATVPTLTGLYLGTVYVGTTAGQLNDSGGSGATGGLRFVWNAFNRTPRTLQLNPSNASTSSASLAEIGGAGNGRVQYVVGLAGEALEYNQVWGWSSNGGAGVGYALFDVGEDNTTGSTGIVDSECAAGFQQSVSNSHVLIPAIGLHYLAMLYGSNGTQTASVVGAHTYLTALFLA